MLKFVLLPGEGMALDHALRTCAQIGICALKVLQTVFKEQFAMIGAEAKIQKAAAPF
jgi:hypothetical protein